MHYLRASKNIFFCQVLTLFLFTLLSGGHIWATTYYVDATNGDDTNPGTQENLAWQTVKKVNDYDASPVTNFDPGDNIFFKRGEVWHESLVIRSSGTASSPITFGAYGSGDIPLFDGTYSGFPIPLQWESVQENIYRTTQPSFRNNPYLLIYKGVAKPSITTLRFGTVPSTLKKGAILKQGSATTLWVTSTSATTVSGITVSNVPFNPSKYVDVLQRNASGREEVWTNPLGTPTLITSKDSLTEPGHWYWNEQEKSVYCYAEASPNTIDIKLGNLTVGINSGHQDFITIQDIAVQGYKEVGILLINTQGAKVQNTHVSNIGASGDKTGILINNSQNNLIKNNWVESSLRTGIAIYNGGQEISQGVSQYNEVSGNTVLNSAADGIALATNGPAVAYMVQNNTIIGNTVSNANALAYDAAGIYAYYVGGGNKIENNTIKGGGNNELRSAGIMIEGGSNPALKPVTISKNIIENNSMSGISIAGKGHQVVNNTLRYNGFPTWEGEIGQLIFFTSHDTNAVSCNVKDNLMQGNANQVLVAVLNGWGHGSPPHDINKNTYCSTNSTPFCWSGDWVCNDPINFNTWKSVSGHDSDSSFTNGTCPTPSGEKGNLNGVYLLLLQE